LTAVAELYRHTDSGDIALVPGARIKPGDHLFMKVQGSDSAFAYIIDEDEAGKVFLLFPNPRLSPANPLAPNLQRLPMTLKGGGSLADWEVTSAGGRETITTVLMRHPNMEVERRLQELPPARADQHVQYAEVNPVSFL